jgi:hypothetical protein
VTAAPELTVAVVVGGLRHRAQKVIDAVALQTAAERIELVVVDIAPESAGELRLPGNVASSHLALAGHSLAHARGEAVRGANAPMVAFLEDHAVPEPEWAQAIIDVSGEGYAAVGYAFTNGNPRTWMSRGGLMANYAAWAHPARRGEAKLLPGNNVAYDRAALLALGDRLDGLLVVDFNLHTELRRRGGRLFLEARAIASHENFETVNGEIGANFSYCRLMAIERARGWSLARRLFFAAATIPAVPVMKTARLLRGLRGRRELWWQVASTMPVILAVYMSSVLGEARGYLESDASAVGDDFVYWELESERS